MDAQTKIDNLFIEVLKKSDIKHAFVNGFDTYTIYNKQGTLFVIGHNPKTSQYRFDRTPLMMKEYERTQLPTNILPDHTVLYSKIERIYKIYRTVIGEFQPIFDMIDTFCGKKR